MKALGLVVSEKKIFLCFTHDPPGARPVWTQGIYKEDHFTLLYTKYESFGPCCFEEEDFLKFFPMTPPGRGLYGPQGHGWQDL